MTPNFARTMWEHISSNTAYKIKICILNRCCYCRCETTSKFSLNSNMMKALQHDTDLSQKRERLSNEPQGTK